MTRLLALGIMLVALTAGVASRVAGTSSHTTRSPVTVNPIRDVHVARAQRTWHFPAIAGARSLVKLLVFNPNPRTVHVWLRLARQGSVQLKSVSLAPESTPEINLMSIVRKDATGRLALHADGPVVPWRLASRQVPFGIPGLGRQGVNDMPMPARSWSFPALPASHDAVVLTIFNPNPVRVHVTIDISGRTALRPPVSVGAGSSSDIALLSHATAALTVNATGDIVPQRAVLGAHGATSAYGTP